ncbi:protein tyrosine phosphatase family protein [Shewanella kaireitica]|uniref:protein tyrosine phosphatase family protein n=1 Tax=Shewanella kaireitica TaxID=212021 RepID=UPI00200F0178|nr:protein tyrosine phosphatase family protein [Shewanella kaireitica]MCL1094016.1 protein tyrosine phosphatase family protein [Shewanella kaireitica]
MRLIILLTSLFSTIAIAAVSPEKLQEIKALQFNDDNIITAGLPTESQFPLLQQAGVELVINLIPVGNPSGHDDEADFVANTGMQYQQIDVDWQQPTLENVEQFFAIMDANKGKRILIHCAANYRASAFYYLYELKQGHADTDDFKQRTMQPWGKLSESLAEYPQWNTLIETVKQELK